MCVSGRHSVRGRLPIFISPLVPKPAPGYPMLISITTCPLILHEVCLLTTQPRASSSIEISCHTIPMAYDTKRRIHLLSRGRDSLIRTIFPDSSGCLSDNVDRRILAVSNQAVPGVTPRSAQINVEGRPLHAILKAGYVFVILVNCHCKRCWVPRPQCRSYAFITLYVMA